MIKRILICAAVFIVVFIIALAAVFPMTAIVKQEIDRQIALYNIQVTYTNLESGLFSTVIEGISFMGTPVGDLKVSYSPLSLITRRVRVVMDSPIASLSATHRRSELTAEVDADLQRLFKIMGQAFPDLTANVRGQANLTATYNLADMKGKLAISGTDFEVQTPMMPLQLSSFSAGADLDNTSIIITSFNSEPLQIGLSGRVTINPNETKNSLLDLRGEAVGFTFSVRGRLGKPVFSTE